MKTRKKKVVFPTGGKGGSGKTTLTTALAEWYEENQIPCTMLDLDIENKKKGSFSHFFPDRAVKIDMGNDTLTISMGNQNTKLDMGAVTIEAMQGITFKVGQTSIKIDQMGVTMQGMMMKIQGQVQTQVQGLMTQVSGDVMLQAKGAITMIG